MTGSTVPLQRRLRARFDLLRDDPFGPRLSALLTERAGVRKSRGGGWRMKDIEQAAAMLLANGWTLTPPADPGDVTPDPVPGLVSPDPWIEYREVMSRNARDRKSVV